MMFIFITLLAMIFSGINGQTYVATAYLNPTPGAPGGNILGTVVFNTTVVGGVNVTTVTANINGINFGGRQVGMHIHTFGDLRGYLPGAGASVAGGLSAAGHYDPFATGVHGCSALTPHHLGDLGNWDIVSGSITGTKSVPMDLTNIDFVNLIVGRMLVLHNETDDCVTQPTGASGSRIAVGVIGIANVANNLATSQTTATKGVCVLRGTSNRPTSLGSAGVIVFEQVAGPRISVVGRLVPGDTNEHGFHVHQYGDVSAFDGTSTGGHLNLDGASHGLPGVNPVRHLGDFGSFKVYDGVGNGWYNFTPTDYTPASSQVMTNFMGRGVVIHLDLDHGNEPTCPGSNTTGASGSRSFTCVIGEFNTADQSVPANALENPTPPAGLTFTNTWANVPCGATNAPTPATSNGNTIIPFTSPSLFPESIAFNPYTGRYIVGSMSQGGVWEVDTKGNVTLVASLNVTGMGTFGVRVWNNLLYVCANRYAAPPAFQASPQSIIFVFRLDTVAPYPIVGYADLTNVGSYPNRYCNDMTNDPNFLFVTDSFAGVIYRMDALFNVIVWSDEPTWKVASGAVGLNGIVWRSGVILVNMQTANRFYRITIFSDGTALPGVAIVFQAGVLTVPGNPNAMRLLTPLSSRYQATIFPLLVTFRQGAVILFSNDGFTSFYSASNQWISSSINIPSIVGANGVYTALGSDIHLFGVQAVDRYELIQLGPNTINGLYPPPSQAWIAGVIVGVILGVFIVALVAYYFYLTKLDEDKY